MVYHTSMAQKEGPSTFVFFIARIGIFIDREAREIMHLVASVRLSVCLFVCALLFEPFDLWSHYQFKVFVCVSLISGRMRIIARMRSIGVLIDF